MPHGKSLAGSIKLCGGSILLLAFPGLDQYLNRRDSCGTKYAVRCRLAIVLLTIAAWLVASDHCALAGVLLQPTVEDSCPGHSSEPEKSPNQGELLCCKALSATLAPAKISGGYDLNLFGLQPYLEFNFQLVFGNSAAPAAELDTGPPGIRTFAESVLQRSLLAHAPPRLS